MTGTIKRALENVQEYFEAVENNGILPFNAKKGLELVAEALCEVVWVPFGYSSPLSAGPYVNVWVALDQQAKSEVERPYDVIKARYRPDTHQYFTGEGPSHSDVTDRVRYWCYCHDAPKAPLHGLADEYFLTNVNAHSGAIDMELKGEPLKLFAEAFLPHFRHEKAKNYVTVSMHHPDVGNFSITLQKENGLTPAQRIEEKTQAIQKLESKLEDQNAVIEQLKQKLAEHEGVAYGVENAEQ